MIETSLRLISRKIAAALALVLPLLVLTSPVAAALVVVDAFDGQRYLGTRSISLTNFDGLSAMPSFAESGGIATITLPTNDNSLTQVGLSYRWSIPQDFTDGGLNDQFFVQFANTELNFTGSNGVVGSVQIRVLTVNGTSSTTGIGISEYASPHLFTYPFAFFTGTADFTRVTGVDVTFTSPINHRGFGARSIFRVDFIQGTPPGGSPPLPPYAVIAPAAGQANPAASGPINFTVEFNSPVFGFTVDDIQLAGTANPTTKALTGSGSLYSVAVNGMTNPGSVSINIPAGAVQDAWDQVNSASSGPPVLFGIPPSMTSLPPAAGMVNSSYSAQYTASGDAPITYSLFSGSLPNGLTLTNGGLLSGVPTRAGTFTGQVRASSPYGSTSQNFSIVIGCPTFSVQPATVQAATAAVAYSQAFSITNEVGAGSVTYAVTGGSLPNGLNLTGDTLSGTPLVSGGPFNFTVTATHASTCTASQAYSMTINPPALALTPTSSLSGIAGAAFSQAFSASGGNGTYTYAVTNGAVPAGLTFSGDTLSGTPTESGTFSFEITATDQTVPAGSGSQTYSLTIAPPNIVVSPASLPIAAAAVAYNQSFSAAGGNGSYTFSLASGSVPAGLNLVGATLSGTPLESGSFTFEIAATDQTTPAGSGTLSYTLTVAPPSIVVSPTLLPSGTAASAYSQTISATGGNGTYSYAVTGGALPAGLTLDSGSGVLSGTPTASGTFTFDITATDQTSPAGSGSRNYTLAIAVPNITVAPTAVSGATAGAAYSQSFSGSGGNGSYTFAMTAGTLPTGLGFDAGTATVSGTPLASGSFTFDITATDQTTPAGSGSRSYTLNVAPPTITLSPPSLTSGIGGEPHNQSVSASGGIGTYTYTLTNGTLPNGLTFSGGTISGTPTASGTFPIEITATDQTTPPASTSQIYSLVIDPATLSMTPSALPSATTGFDYTANFVGMGGVPPYSFAISGGALPSGISLASDGTLGGTTFDSGAFSFDVTLTDSSTPAASTTATHTLDVNLPVLTLEPAILLPAVVGTPYSATFTGLNGVAPYDFSTTDTLPAGLLLDPGGVLSGLPILEGVYTFSITLSDLTGATTSNTYSLTIALTPPVIPEPPPPLPCPEYNFQTESVVRAVVADQLMAIGCNILYENGQPMMWMGGSVTNAGSIGVQSVLDRGVIQAVDVFLPNGEGKFNGDAVVCLRGSGAMVFLAASGIPRTPQDLIAWQTPAFPGYTCATLYQPGTLVLVQSHEEPLQVSD